MSEKTETESLTVRPWPDAGRMLSLGRNAVYDAIARGEIPVLRFGRRIVVPKRALERMLNGEAA
jgi:excisionase family DNA binding protein